MNIKYALEELVRYGFFVVLAATFLLFSVLTEHFLSGENILNIFHTMAPLAIIASGLGLVIISGRLDISVGSTAFLSCAIGALLMKDHGLDPILATFVVLVCGAFLGAVNGAIVSVLKVNSLIATLGTMIAYRGIALSLTDALLVPLPEPIRVLGNARLGPIPTDILIMLVILVGVHLLHAKTAFGRQLVAMGNDVAIARKVGLPVDRTGFLSFVLAGVLASVGGILTTVQNGAVSPWLGSGVEFTALAAVVVGGISLLGGRGTILFSIIPGAFIFEMIRNGLTHLGATPYSYRLVGGAVIFAAMYADALKSGRVSLRWRTAP
ncbi:ABC transporter permease [Mesorhizobium sp. AR10]|uniref:ABC transporter permease n=1 Tax=Mesorhizobium sp. AR10 TaxID=2865839 RepID=UPI0021608192|nr:ABC transporter permease [Mesorhizobium sp. AR10]UVK38802.1 ABC transporter permease [Mesorhizobium sp. AR10]